MLGAIIGDVVGSYYEVLEAIYQKENKTNRPYEERIKIMNESIPLFTEMCSYTDDSVLTTAIADALIHNNHDYEHYLREYGTREINLGFDIYGRSRFGSSFINWLKSDYQGFSFGNGAPMRVSPIGYLNSLNEVKRESYLATIPSHNHIDAIIGAEAVSTSIYLLRNGYSKEKVKKYIEQNYYNLNFDLEELRKNYKFSSKSSKSVPQALYIFLISANFEDAIRKSISIGGDTDTIGAIVGGLSEAYYGLDENLISSVKPYLKDYMIQVIDEFYEKNNLKLRKVL